MSNIQQNLRGMKDLLPDDFQIHKYIIEEVENIAKLYGYSQMSTPILEYTKIFDRTLGNNSDVVSKEMYSFLDKNNESIALRPEFTACIVRAFLSNNLQNALPAKLFSTGPLFRHERPQAGRQRQFHQLNFEYIGAVGAYTDAETIKLASDILTKFDLLKDVTLELNSLGCQESRGNYQKALVEYYTKYINELSEDSKVRLNKNPLRILDSKNENDQKISKDAPLIQDFYTKDSAEYFDQLREYLTVFDVDFTLSSGLVRGLDYYCHTAFEFTTTKLGAQGTVLAGGRYDGLVELMGGPSTPAIGFAAGIERLAMMREFELSKPRMSFIIPIGEECTNYAIKLSSRFRAENIPVILDLKGKIQKRMQRALENNGLTIIFIGPDEMNNNNYKLKNLDTKEEKSLSLNELLSFYK